MSRHVGAIRQTIGVSPEEIALEQAKNPFCQRLNLGTHADKGEFFLDGQGLIYRRKSDDQSQLLVPLALVNEVIRENHSPAFAAHPGVRRTRDLIALKFWWAGMWRSIEEYIKACDECQRRKEGGEYRAPVGEVEESTAPFQITSMDITGPYPLTPRRNRYILTFIDHYTKYVEAFPIPDQSAQTCARVYATEILTRHGTGSKLITDQGTAFMSVFFNETCKALGIRRAHTTPYHPSSNGMVERLHNSLHAGLSHYVNSTHTNWDEVLPFFLMAYRATPNVTTGYSPFFLFHGRDDTPK